MQNHKLVTIEFIDKTADVYDIEVADNHNFALGAGIFVHNSKDQADAVCGSIFNASKYAAEFAYTYGETAETILRINMGENTYGDNLLQNSSEELRNQLMSREDNIFRIQKEHMKKVLILLKK